MTTEMVEAAISAFPYPKPTAAKRGRNPKWPYVPVLDYGRFTKQILGRAYSTRGEAVQAAAAAVAQLKQLDDRKLWRVGSRAMRRQFGLPGDISNGVR